MSELLENIQSPADLKSLSLSQLYTLAGEIRERIIVTTAQTGGHLAPSLGAVELTIALHRELNSPIDKIIWDVGHQCYAHKLLTGRQKEFANLRQYGGLSGFTRRQESPHDPFGAGHGSTSISAALGFATARDLRGGDETIVAVIGDGALTGGLALEALNQAGEQQRDLVVVLNDNEMSISHNVGAMSGYLATLRATLHPAGRRAREDALRLLRRIPMGEDMVHALDRVKLGIKQLVVPGMLFEQFGFTYLGPIDGHNIAHMSSLLGHAVRIKGPVLVHLLTQKGRGYEPAENNPRRFHGTSPFLPENGETVSSRQQPTFSEVLGQTVCELAEDDERIVAISAAMLDGTGLDQFKKLFPGRCFDVGMAEEHAVTYAAGLAAAGMRPIVAIYSTFLQRSYDQIIHDVALQNLPVVFAVDRAGLVGADGPTHHGLFDLSYLRHIPNMTVMAPSDRAELRHMLATALTLDSPAALRYPRGCGPAVDWQVPLEPLPVGKGKVRREGNDIAVVAVGNCVAAALEAAEVLSKQGIDATVVDARFVKPLDEDLIISLANNIGAIITVEENVRAGGFGSAVAELLNDCGPDDVRLVRLGVPDEFVTFGGVEHLRADVGIDTEAIVQAAAKVCRGADVAYVSK